MDQPLGEREHEQLQFLRVLEEENALISGDVVQVSEEMWVIHGIIPVDGDVLMAEFESYDHARSVLEQLRSGAVGENDR